MKFLKHIPQSFFISLIILLSTTSDVIYASEIMIVAHPSVSEVALKPDDLRDIYLGDKTTWVNGTKIHFAVIRKGKVHQFFLNTYIDKSPSIYIRYWKRQLLTGKKATLPKLISTEEAVVDFVTKTEGGIGYVSSKCPVGNLKIIKIVEYSPDNK